MKSIAFLLAAFLLALTAPPASAVIIGVDHFDYPDGPIVGKNGGTFWDWKNTAPTGHTGSPSNWDVAFGTPGVSGGQLVTNNSGARREYNGNTETSGAVNDFNDQKVVYYRATITTGATLPQFFYFMSDDAGTERVLIGKLFGQSVFGVAVVGNPGVNSGITIMPNTTYTLVAKIDYDGDEVSLFVNPVFNGVEPAPSATALFESTSPSTAVRMGSGFSGDAIRWEDLMVATAWSDLNTIVTVETDEDDGFLGGGAGVSLREAVKYSPTGSLITFAPALSGQTIVFTAGQMAVDKDLTIDATALPGGLTLSGNNAARHFEVQSGRSLTLRGLTLIQGNSLGSPYPTVGGSIANLGGTLTLTQCTLTGNTSPNGGAIYNESVGNPAVLNLQRCTFTENSASAVGGAIYHFSGSIQATACTFSVNTASRGGAIWHQSNSGVILSHCTISGNRAGGVGGGIASIIGPLTLQHCTISQNTGAGGGLILQAPASTVIHSSIIAGNTNPSGSRTDINYLGGSLTATGTNLIGDNTSVEAQFPAVANLVGTAAAPVNPKLSPLGYFGGPVQTMHPLIGSPAIDAAGTINPGGTDARGFPRFVDGDASGFEQLDIGSVEAGPLSIVSNAADTLAATTLRTRINNAAGIPGARVGFLAAAFPATITLGGTEIEIPATANGLFIDASNLSAPVTLSGNHASRVFNIPSGATVAMHSVRIVNGKTADGANGDNLGSAGDDGGGILNEGSLSLFSCTLSGNATGNGGNGGPGSGSSGGFGGAGGGIFSSGLLSLTACTLSGNETGNGGSGRFLAGSGGGGGGIFSSGFLSLTACTLSGNATGNGGANGGNGGSGAGIRQEGANSYGLSGCTLAGNQTGIGGVGRNIGSSGTGGGIFGGNAILENCLIGLNTQGPSTPNDVSVTTITYVGANLLSTAATGTATGSPTINPNPLLAPLGDYGGPTQTLPPLPGSPAINAAIGNNRLTDQRGFPIVGTADIGAAEYQGITDLRLYWESDWDGDGNAFGVEHALGTNPALSDPANSRNFSGPTFTPVGQASLTFGRNTSAAPGTISIVKRSTDLITFSEVFRITGNSPVPGLGISAIILPDSITILDSNPPPGKAFYRIEAVSP